VQQNTVFIWEVSSSKEQNSTLLSESHRNPSTSYPSLRFQQNRIY